MSGVRITNCATGADRLWPFASLNATMRQLENAFRASLGLSGHLKDYETSLASGRRSETPPMAESFRISGEELSGFQRTRLDIEIKDRFGNPVIPGVNGFLCRYTSSTKRNLRTLQCRPGQARKPRPPVDRIKDGTITDYLYDPQAASLVRVREH
jgi:hypothetical protein